jgi:hypothetical protein
VAKDPVEVRANDVFGFVTAQQRARVGAENVARISDGGSGLSAATVRRRLAAGTAFYGYLIARRDVGVETSPVPRGLPATAAAMARRTVWPRVHGRGQPDTRAPERPEEHQSGGRSTERRHHRGQCAHLLRQPHSRRSARPYPVRGRRVCRSRI